MNKKTATNAPPKDIDDYLARVSPEARATLEKLRKTIKSVVPAAVETISYQMPTFKYKGRMLVSFAAFKDHCSFFPGAEPVAVHKGDLEGYETSKGTIRFPINKPLPAALVKKLLKVGIARNEARGGYGAGSRKRR